MSLRSYRRKRVFTGPDGRPYRWDLKSSVVVVGAFHSSRLRALCLLVLAFAERWDSD